MGRRTRGCALASSLQSCEWAPRARMSSSPPWRRSLQPLHGCYASLPSSFCGLAFGCGLGVAGIVWVVMRPLIGGIMLLVFCLCFGGAAALKFLAQKKDAGGGGNNTDVENGGNTDVENGNNTEVENRNNTDDQNGNNTDVQNES